MPGAEFDSYFDERAARFSRFYGNERVARLLGRGALFDRLRKSVDMLVGLGAQDVLDVGCGSGPMFAPLAARGVHVLGIDPAPAMVRLARQEAARHPGSVEVQQRGWEQIEERDAFDAAVALGVFDYVDDPVAVLERLIRAAPRVIASFPAPGLRLRFRRFRYGARGVHVHGYGGDGLARLARSCAAVIEEIAPLGRAGNLVRFARP
jgi:SAM-dependent methyltransferase